MGIDGTIHEQPEGFLDDESEIEAIFLGIKLDEELRLSQEKEFEVEVFYAKRWLKGKMSPPSTPSYDRTFITVLKADWV